MKAQVLLGDPGGTRLGSPLVGGYSYLYQSYFDFIPQGNSQRSYTDSGVWGTTQPVLRTSVDLPFGAVLRDVEFYVTATASVGLTAELWRNQVGTPYTIDLRWFPGAFTGMRALRLVIPDDKRGPYAPGSRLVLGVQNSGPTVQLNGARVAYSRGPAGVVLLDKPVRVYDSRSGAKIGNGQTRIHSLAGHVPAGATSAILHLTAANGEKYGGLAVYGAGTTVPYGSAVYWGAATTSIEIQTRLTNDRKIKITMRGVPGSKVHFFYDVVGYTTG